MTDHKDLEMYNKLQDIRKKEMNDETTLYRQKVENERARARGVEFQELRNKGRSKDERSGRDISLWDDVMSKAQNAINAEVMSYNDWRAAMMGLLTMFGAFTKAASHTINENILFPAKQLIVDKGILGLKDKLEDAFIGNVQVDLPMLKHYVNLNDDGTLNIELSRSDTQAKIPELDELFKKGIVLWLETNDFTPDPANPDKFVDLAGVSLDKITFDRLKEDPDTGLEHFLTDYSELKFKPGM
jgi:hypothetical protein